MVFLDVKIVVRGESGYTHECELDETEMKLIMKSSRIFHDKIHALEAMEMKYVGK